jgi:hypothetical protein
MLYKSLYWARGNLPGEWWQCLSWAGSAGAVAADSETAVVAVDLAEWSAPSSVLLHCWQAPDQEASNQELHNTRL